MTTDHRHPARTASGLRHVPNALSLLRLGLAAAFPFIPAAWRLPVVLAGGFSDWLDGAIARRFDLRTVRGALLDAVADKLFVLSVLATMLAGSQIAWWQVVLVLVRDFAVGITAAYAAVTRQWSRFADMRPRILGKLTTAAVLAWLVVIVAAGAEPLRTPLFAFAAACSTSAGADYLQRFVRALAARRRERAHGGGGES
jgi:phosphatidylglycerophosphate synthase